LRSGWGGEGRQFSFISSWTRSGSGGWSHARPRSALHGGQRQGFASGGAPREAGIRGGGGGKRRAAIPPDHLE
jgi:hypothetical protein